MLLSVIAAPIMQYNGTKQGFMLDPESEDLTPLINNQGTAQLVSVSINGLGPLHITSHYDLELCPYSGV